MSYHPKVKHHHKMVLCPSCLGCHAIPEFLKLTVIVPLPDRRMANSLPMPCPRAVTSSGEGGSACLAS